jgi:hypothetical protein
MTLPFLWMFTSCGLNKEQKSAELLYTAFFAALQSVVAPTNDRFLKPQHCCYIIKKNMISTSGP